MSKDTAISDPPIPVMTMDLLGQILSRSDNPIELGKYLSEEISKLTGARCVLLIRVPDSSDISEPQILAVHPERRREWAESGEVLQIFRSHLNDKKPFTWDNHQDDHQSEILKREGFHISLSIPLMIGEIQVGSLFTLGLPDIIHLGSVITLLSTLSTIVALVLRNAYLYERQEELIDERTSELQAAGEEIRSELEERKHIEETLRDMSVFQENIISNARVWIMVLDGKGTILLWNTAAEEITGYKAVEILGKRDIWKFLYPEKEYRSQITRHIKQIISEKKYLENFETTIHTKSGDEKIISWNTRDFPEVSGQKQKYIAIGMDVTDRRLAEQRLLVSEERYSDLFSKSQNAIAIYQAVEDGNNFIIVDFNPAAEIIEQVHRDDIVGRQVTEVFPGVVEFGLFDVFRRVYQTGTPEHHDISLYKDYRIQGWRENLVYRLSSGEIVAMYTDVSERKRNEELLKENNAYLENLIAIANVPIIVWDKSFHIIRLNHACEWLIGRAEGELVGKSLEVLFPAEKIDYSRRLLQTTLEGVRLETVQIDILHADGSIRNILWNSATLYSPDGNAPIATIAQGRDITEELRLEREKDAALVQIQRNLAQLAILNDEIRNPLTIIIACSEMFGDAGITNQILVQTQRIDNIVNNLDKRWIQSEKVLNAIRKHYHLHISPSAEDERTFNLNGEKSEDEPGLHDRKDTLLLKEIQAELYTILDSIDALIYVADMDTYDLLYLNRHGRNLFGDIAGKKCYQVIYKDQHSPCPFCTNSRLFDDSGPTGVYTWEVVNSHNNRWYDCRDRAIRWTDGRIVRLEIATDITGRKKVEEALKQTIDELRSFNALTVGREIRMIELKSEINAILKAAGKPEKYQVNL